MYVSFPVIQNEAASTHIHITFTRAVQLNSFVAATHDYLFIKQEKSQLDFSRFVRIGSLLLQ